MMVLPPQTGLFLSSSQKGDHVGLGLGERTRQDGMWQLGGHPKSRRRDETRMYQKGG